MSLAVWVILGALLLFLIAFAVDLVLADRAEEREKEAWIEEVVETFSNPE